jgi:hypothetical protein
MKHRDSLPEDVQRFILLGIPSVPYLEALLLLHGDPARAWACQEVARRLYLTDKAAQVVLAELAAAGVTQLVADSGDGAALAGATSMPGGDGEDTSSEPANASVRYAPQTLELQEMIDRLAVIYPRHIVAVSELIHSRGRHSRAQQFADAFVLRKENP